MTALFEDLIFGPIHSRRLGISLGVNLLPQRAKICNFDCIYCECGSNSERRGESSARRFADREEVLTALRERLVDLSQEGVVPDVITFAGNGEPTLHPDFEYIIAQTKQICAELAPSAKLSVLSNATRLDDESVVRALHTIDNNILKVDSAIECTAKLINGAPAGYSVGRVIEQLTQKFSGECIVQTMLLRGVVGGESFDNTTEEELTAWVAAIERIAPRSVMIYTIDRDTPCKSLERATREDLERAAAMLRAKGVECSVA